MSATVRIYVVTYRRPHLLERALRSLLTQTHSSWVAEVLNDDPTDYRVHKLLHKLSDTRIQLSVPGRHRGATANFNYAFRSVHEPYASVLEDDNWWEPRFLEVMIAALRERDHIVLAAANERVWKEQRDGSWLDTGKTIWPVDKGIQEFECRPLDKCGTAKLCNSSMLFQTRGAEVFQTPNSIPVDVTEHFRERVVPHPILLVHTPLVNYGETLVTHRSKGHRLWHQYQMLLIGSVFKNAKAQDRAGLASALWQEVRLQRPSSPNVLLLTGIFVAEARDLWHQGTWFEKLSFARSCLRRPSTLMHGRSALRDHQYAWDFLQRGWFAEFMKHGCSSVVRKADS